MHAIAHLTFTLSLLTPVTLSQSWTEDFEGGSNDAGWEIWFSVYNSVEPSGGNPGGYLRLDNVSGPATSASPLRKIFTIRATSATTRTTAASTPSARAPAVVRDAGAGAMGRGSVDRRDPQRSQWWLNEGLAAPHAGQFTESTGACSVVTWVSEGPLGGGGEAVVAAGSAGGVDAGGSDSSKGSNRSSN